MVSKRRAFSGGHFRHVFSLLGAILLALSCQTEGHQSTGGETHFLTECSADSSSCGSEFSCLCGVCTLPCTERTACGQFPVAECLTSEAVACGEPGAHCDAPCASDADCAVISPAHRCEGGACRVPSASGSGGSGGADGGAGCVRGEVPANQVLLLGDSFFASSHQITAYLEDLARAAGTLSAGDRYRDNSRLIANALALRGTGIADEYSAAIAEAPVDVVIMNGGGADVLGAACATPDPSCPALAAAATAASALFAQMAQDGVQHVIYAFYPDPVDANLRAVMDAFRPLAQSACAASPVPCAWLDLRPVFAGHYAEYVQADGLNPTAAGSQASAAAIWTLMSDQCIGT